MPLRFAAAAWPPTTHPVRRTGAAWLLLAAGVVSSVGCQSTGAVDNPVVGPRPPRIADELLAQMEASDRASAASDEAATSDAAFSRAADEDAGIQMASLEETVASGGPVLRDDDIAARINGHPIFVSEVLEPYRQQLNAQESQIPPGKFQEIRYGLVQKDLPNYIEQTLVLEAARAQFKQDQWDELQAKLDEIFYDEEVPELQKRLKVGSLREAEKKLQDAGTSLSAYRRIWGDRQIAGQWVSEKLPTVTASRQDLLDEYNRKLDSYREPEQVRWQQCLISFADSGGEDEARRKVGQAISDLKDGQSFDDVVAKYSDGPTVDGGHWDWTQTSSLADEELRKTLTSLKLNQIGPVLEDERGFRLVKLTGYRAERIIPFEEVQQELREAVVQRRRAEAAQQIIEDLKATARIETVFDSDAAG